MIINGTGLALRYKDELKAKIEKLEVKPKLAVVLVGDNKASISYIKSKEKAASYVGIEFLLIKKEEETTQDELIKLIDDLNKDDTVDGILVQMPLPKHIDAKMIMDHIDPDKDVDGLNKLNVGKLALHEDGFVPCTPLGVMAILKEMGVDIKGKHAVVIGRSSLVGSPLSKLLLNADATVTVCHRNTQDLKSITRLADILVVAIGQARYIDDSYIKEGAYVVDVGINHVDGKLCGDVDFDKVVDKVKAITPVPKGVGPMTVCMLMENVYKAYELRGKR